MNTILPRINQHRGKATVNFGNHPTVLVRGNNSVLPRLGGGVPAKVVLANSGIKRGPLVKVSGWDADAKRREKEAQEKLEAAKREAAKRAEEKRRAEELAKAEAERREKAEAERRAAEAVKPLTETEERLTDLLEAAQEMKPIADAVIPEAKDEPVAAQEEKPAAEVAFPRKKKRGRKGKKAGAAMMALEQELL